MTIEVLVAFNVEVPEDTNVDDVILVTKGRPIDLLDFREMITGRVVSLKINEFETLDVRALGKEA